MESLNESEAMRVLQAAAAMDAARSAGNRHGNLPTARSPAVTQQQQQQQQLAAMDANQPPAQGFGDDVWREMEETEGGGAKRPGDLDTWLDVFRATATSVRNSWRHMECLSYESLAFGWLALARKHEPLQVAPAAASGLDITDIAMPAWLSEAQWAQAAFRATSEEQLRHLLGLQAGELLACNPGPSGSRPAFFLAVHHGSRTVRLVVRGSGQHRELLLHAAGSSSAFGAGFAHQGLLQAAEELLQAAEGPLRAALGAHPQYGLQVIGHALGAGIAALLAILISTDSSRLGFAPPISQQPGEHPDAAPAPGPVPTATLRVRATCFGPPPLVTAEVAEQCAPYIDSVVYNTDLISRCSVASLRRLANEIAVASEEVLARSELAQALRRSGALGLANHLVAAALCRCQPPQEAAGINRPVASGPGPVAEGVEVPPAPAGTVPPVKAAASASAPPLPPSPSPPAPAIPQGALRAPPPHQPATRTTQSQTQAPSHGLHIKSATSRCPTTASEFASPAKAAAAAAATRDAADAPHSEGEQLRPSSHSAPLPSGSTSGFTLPPLVPAAGAGGGGGGSGLRSGGASQGVLSPPPLVAAAAAAAASASNNTAVPAIGHTPSRRVLMVGSLGDLKTGAVQQEVRTTPAALAAAAAAQASNGGDDGSGRSDGASVVPNAAAGVVLEPLAAPPTVPAGVALPAGPRRDTLAADCLAIIMPLASPVQLPPLQLPLQSQSSSRPITVRGGNTQGMEAQGADKAGRLLAELLPPEQASVKVQQLQLLQPQGGVDSEGRSGSPASSSGQEVHELQVPGRLYVIERRGADAHATFRLLQEVSRSHLSRILLKRCILRDHLLSHYVATLERLVHNVTSSTPPEAPATP